MAGPIRRGVAAQLHPSGLWCAHGLASPEDLAALHRGLRCHALEPRGAREVKWFGANWRGYGDLSPAEPLPGECREVVDRICRRVRFPSPNVATLHRYRRAGAKAVGSDLYGGALSSRRVAIAPHTDDRRLEGRGGVLMLQLTGRADLVLSEGAEVCAVAERRPGTACICDHAAFRVPFRHAVLWPASAPTGAEMMTLTLRSLRSLPPPSPAAAPRRAHSAPPGPRAAPPPDRPSAPPAPRAPRLPAGLELRFHRASGAELRRRVGELCGAARRALVCVRDTAEAAAWARVLEGARAVGAPAPAEADSVAAFAAGRCHTLVCGDAGLHGRRIPAATVISADTPGDAGAFLKRLRMSGRGGVAHAFLEDGRGGGLLRPIVAALRYCGQQPPPWVCRSAEGGDAAPRGRPSSRGPAPRPAPALTQCT